MRAVNLLPPDRKQADGRGGVAGSAGGGALTNTRVAIAGGSLAAIVCGLVGFMYVGARNDVATQRTALNAIEQQVAEAQAKALAQSQAQHQQAAQTALPEDIKAQLDAFNMVAAQRIRWDLLLGDVSRVIPAGSWLSSLTLQGAPATPADPSNPTPPVAANPTGFVASGFALSHKTVARLMQQLALVPMLSDITLQRSERANVGADRAFQFTLSANVRLDAVS